jgi:hypothetical protein
MFDTTTSNLDPTANKPSLQKAKLTYTAGGASKTLDFQFNPQTLAITKTASWASTSTDPDKKKETLNDKLNAPTLKFSGGESATFSLKLIFDTTLLNNQDVRGYTNQLLSLTLKGGGSPQQPNDPPPTVKFIWGELELFEAVVTSVTITYTMFLASGIPVRANADVSFRQATDEDAPQSGQNPTSRTDSRRTYIVQQGDRLDYLAYREYGKSSRWREIAEANQLENPLDLQPGQILVIPGRQ